MNNKNSDESRRKILKSIAAGSGAIIAGKNLPENWTRPVVDSVILPSHAQTSLAVTFSCGPATATAVEGSSSDNDNVNIFSGGSACNTTVTQNNPGDADIVLSLDASATGGTAGTWRTDGSGANWTTTPSFGSGTAPGNYAFTATRTGGLQYSLTLTVGIVLVSSGPPDTYDMTISNIVFTQL